ncbi:MAG: dihydropteroate synthase [Myxococcota bacterium]
MAQIIGILNITPDSCSDGGLYMETYKAVEHAHQMLSDGAAWIDVGGESTRPGATPITPEEELARVLPVIKALIASGVRNLSIDTRNATTARSCLEAGALWLNDVSALSHDPYMLTLAKDFEHVTLMHMYGASHDIISEIATFLKNRVEIAVNAGVSLGRISIDPGIGFGKSADQDFTILKNLSAFSPIAPVYAGPSRKKFMGPLLGLPNYGPERDYGTIGAVLHAAQNGASYIRVHNVRAAVDALKVLGAIMSAGNL